MNSHKNARTTALSRSGIARRVHAGVPVAVVSRAFGVCDRTVVRKWADRARTKRLPLEDARVDRAHRRGRSRPEVMVDRAAAPPAPHRRRDREHRGRQPRDGEPHAAIAGIEQAQCAGAARGDPAL